MGRRLSWVSLDRRSN